MSAFAKPPAVVDDGKEHYGSLLGLLHPERADTTSAALDRYEAGEDTPSDRVLLWADVALCAAWTEQERLRNALRSVLYDPAAREAAIASELVQAAQARAAESDRQWEGLLAMQRSGVAEFQRAREEWGLERRQMRDEIRSLEERLKQAGGGL